MAPGFRAFMTGLIDYAGLFPPADLGLDEAVDTFARHRTGKDQWMLGRFILPVDMLEDLAEFENRFSEDQPLFLSILGGTVSAREMSALRSVVDAGRLFEERYTGEVVADRFEFRLSRSTAGDANALSELFEFADEALRTRSGSEARSFYELSLLDEFSQRELETTAEVASAHNANAAHPSAGLKFRCGGVTPDAFPTPDVLATAIRVCREVGAPFKATAGLHHPVRHYAEDIGAMMHGFLNVFGAAVLADANDLDRSAIERILLDEQPNHFRFDEEGFRWTDVGASAEEVERARLRFATSFGSCSFDEPRDDLAELGLMDR